MSTPAKSPSTGTARRSRLVTAARAMAQAGRHAPAVTVPRGAGVSEAFIAAACNYRRCSVENRRLAAEWQEFSARHPFEDPRHEEFGMRMQASRKALNGADAAFVAALEQIGNGAGE